MAVRWKEIVSDLKSNTRSEALPLFCFDCCFDPCRSHPQCYTDSRARNDPREVEPDAEPILTLKHSTPRWRLQLNRTPDVPCTPITPIPLDPQHKSVEEEWCSSMATPSPMNGFPERSSERKFLQSTTSSVHTDVSLVVQSLIDDDMLLNPVRDRCSAIFPAADSTPRRMRQSTSHKVKQLVAMFNIEEDSLHQDVVRVTSLPNMTSETSVLNSPLTGVDRPTTPRQCTPGGLLPSPQDCSQDLFYCTTPPVGAGPTVGRARKRAGICSELSMGDLGDCDQPESGVLVDEDPIPPVCGGVDEDPIPPVRGGVDEDPIPPVHGGVDEDPIPPVRGGVDEDPIPPVCGELVQDSMELTTREAQPQNDILDASKQKNVLSAFAYPMNNTSTKVEATAVICEEQPQTDNQHKTVRRASNSKAKVYKQLHPHASGPAGTEAHTHTLTSQHMSPLTLPDTIMSRTPEGIAGQQVTNGTGSKASCPVLSRKRLSRPKRSQKRRRTDSDRELHSDGASTVEVHQELTLNREDCPLLAKTCKGDKDANSIQEGQLQQEEGSSCIEPLSNAPSNFTHQTVHEPTPHNQGPLHPQPVTSKPTLTAPKVRGHTGRRSALFKPPRSMKDVSMKEEMASRRKLLKGFGINVDVKKDATSPSLPNVPLTSCLFQTASGKSCQPSLESMSTARQFLQTCTDEFTSGGCVTPNTLTPNLESNPPFMSGSHIPPSTVGFSTASGKRLAASSESINRAKQLLGEECSTGQGSGSVVQTGLEGDRCVGINMVEDHQRLDDVPGGLGSHVHSGQDKATLGFSTASGKTLTVSARAMELGRSLLDQVSDSNDSGVCRTATGFSTASGKRLSVSTGAVHRVRNILSTRESTVHDLMEGVEGGVQGGVVEGVEGDVVEGVQGGVVDEESQVKSIESLDLNSFTKFTQLPQPEYTPFSNTEETHENSQYSSPTADLPNKSPTEDLPVQGPTEDLPNKGPTEDLPVQRPTENLPVQGPTEDLPVQGPTEDLPVQGPTEESLSSTATLDSSVDFLADLNTQVLNELHSSPGEEIKYCSKEESSKNNDFLAEAKVTGSHEVCLTTSQPTTGETMHNAVEVLGTSLRTPTLQTASGRAVSVKEESLQHVRSRMEESLPVTLQTASGKEVTISQPALEQAKSLLVACNCAEYETAGVSMSLSSLFSTASGKSVSVSKKALKAVKESMVKNDGSTVEDVGPKPTSVSITVSHRELPPPGNQMLDPILCPQQERPQGPSALTGVTPERRYVPKFISHKGGAAPSKTPSEHQTPLKNCNYSQASSSTFRPCVHSTPEAFLADRQNLKKSFLISELHTPPLKTQMKKFVYSVPFRPRAGKAGGGVSRSLSLNCSYYKPIVKTPSSLLISPRTTPTSHQVTPISSQVAPTNPQVTPTSSQVTPTSSQVTPTSPQVTSTSPQVTSTSPRDTPTNPRDTPKNPQVISKHSICAMRPDDPGRAPHSQIHPLLERPVANDQSLEVTGDMHLSESQLTVFMDMTQPSVSNMDLKSLEQQSHTPPEHTHLLPKHAHTSPEGSHTLLEHTPSSLRHNNQSSDVMEEDSGIGTLPNSGNTSRQSPRGVDHPPVVIKRANIASHSEPKCKRMRTEVADTLNNTMVCFNQVKHSSVSTGTVRPQDGLLYSIRKAHRGHLLPLGALGARRGQYTSEQLLAMGVHPSVLRVSVESAVNFRFPGYLHFSSSVLKGQPVRVGDGAVLHLGQDSSAGVDELERAFSTTPGVDPRLVSSNWFKNHYKWIVWKLASLEVVFPRQCAGRSLTPNWLMLQMKYRYDVEVDHAHRSALKRIYEHDDTPAKTMVLCVSGLSSGVGGLSSTGVSMELSDGWYSIGGAADQVLERMVQRGLIGVGSKLCVSGAELSGLDSPSPPLEAPQGVFLRLHANSTRRARWNAKLGFQGNPEPIHVPLGSILPDGGKVGSTSFLITRVYPLIYMEKTPEGGKIFRSCRAEEQEERRFGKHRQKVLEKICDRETRLFEEDIAKEEASSWSKSKRNRRPNSRSIKSLDSGEDLYNAMQQAPDLISFQEWLSPMQKALLLSYKDNVECQRKDRLQRRIQQALLEAEKKELPAQRDVVPLLKARVVEVNHDLSTPASEATLCVWRPSSDVRQLLKEGIFLKAYHLQASEGRSRGGGLQLTATKFTKYQELKLLCPGKYSPRRVTPLSDLPEAKVHDEVDVVGVVSRITSDSVMTAKGSANVDCVGLSDPSGHSAVIKVWDGLGALGYEDLVHPGAVLSVTNLRVTLHNTTEPSSPVLLASDISVFSQSPKEAYLKKSLADLKRTI